MTRLFPHLLHRSKRARNSRTHRRRLLLEQLEARSLLATFSVVNGDNAGIGSLRQAILNANASPDADLIDFNVAPTDANHFYYKNDGVAGQVTFGNIFTTIASVDSTIADIDPDWAHSWYRIKPTSALPNVTGPVTIDGYTQPGSSVNTLAVGDNASLKIELNGANANLFDAGLVIAAGGSTVRGLVINGFTGNGIVLQTNGGNVVEGNFIGTDVTGTVGLGNGIYGVFAGYGANNNRIGSNGASDFADRNIIFASRRTAGLEGFNYLTGAGIYLASDQNVVAGNYIGTDVTGTQGLGAARSFSAAGVTIDGGHSNNQVGSSGLGTDNVGQRNVIAGNWGIGVYILSNGGGVDQNNVVAGNYIGTNATGTLSVPNAGTGVHLGGAAGNTIVSNLVSGNSQHGVFLDSAQDTVIAGNKIGTDVTGTVALGNGIYGIGGQEIGGGNNLIGGSSAAQRNLISGNRRDGVSINGCICTTIPGPFAVIQGNYIGTDVTGTQALANVGAGVGLSGYKITMGGPGAGNLISGNTGGGITLDGGSEYVIQGNYIGTNAAGTAQIGNGPGQVIYAGVAVYGGAGIIVFNGTQNAIIGGTIAGAGNLISGNNTAGIVIGGNTNLVGPTGTQVQGNRIGTDVTGAAPLGNGGFGGIFVWHGATNTLIGGTAIGAGNTIAFNLADGVKVMDSGTGNAIEENSIHSNTRLGINLVGGIEDTFGVTPNDLGDADTGPNNLQNYPLLSSAIVSGGGTTIQGTLNSTPTSTFRLEFFANAAGDPSGYGEGQTFLGSSTVTTDASGNATFVASLPMAAAVGQFVSSTATDPGNNTSEFSGVRITTACVESSSLVVTTSADVIANDCVASLREAINYANLLPSHDTITFNIPGSGVHTIQPLSALPNVTGPVTIDGYTQPGSSVNTLANGDNAVLKIELSGSNAAGVVSGLVISAGNSTVRGLAIYSFTNRGIQIGGPGGNVIEGNFIGTDATGLVRRGNNAGVSIEDSGGAANLGSRVGTDADGVNDPGERNLFIGNGIGVYLSRAGIPTFATPADNNVVAGNFFGTDRTGTITNPDNIANNGDELGNDVGIRLLTSSFNTIGGTAAAARNVVSGSKFDGINIQGSGVQGNTFTAGNLIQGNFVGTDVSGTIALSNGSPAFDGFGITVGGGERNTIGGSVPGSRNIVSGNARGGIAIGDFGSVVQGNYIGTDVTGTLPLGNTGNTFFPQFGNGVVVFGIGNVIGGIATGQANLIANNVGAGVMVSGNPTSVGHSIRGNSIFANGGLGIDLAPPLTNARGVSGNDVGDGDTGPNGYQNFPVLSSALAFGSGTLISGSLNSTANSTFTLDFYTNTAADPSGYGEGATYLGSAPVTTDGAGNAAFAVTVPGVASIGAIVSSTATDSVGSTSEFSGNGIVATFVPAVISGTKFNDLNGNGIRDTTTNSTGPITVPGYADPWLAGMPDGSTASFGDIAPNQSPILVPIAIAAGSTLTFSATGCVSFGPGGCTGNLPDGTFVFSHTGGPENGISNYHGPVNALFGVFLSPDQPNHTPAPNYLEFGTTASLDYLTLSPELKQVFFIGDGKTSSNQAQQITVPAGATRLYLGTTDGFGWYNNSGAFTVTINASSIEPPLPGWTIQLDAGANGTVDDTRITDTNGNYTFTSLEPGIYRVREVAQSGWTQTTPNPADILVSASGQSYAGVDFGNHRTAACTPQSTELRSHWKADGNALDSADGNNGTLVGGVTFVPGQFGQAFNFDGTDYVQVPDAPNLNPNSAITVEGWIRPVFAGRPAFSADTDTIITKLTPSLNGFGLFVAMDSSFAFYQAPLGGVPLGTPAFFVATGSGIVQIFSPTPLPNDGQFHHVAGTFDGANVRLFVDGIEVVSSAQTGALITTGANLFIGADFSAFSRLSRAAIDDVNLYGRALSQCEIGGTSGGTNGSTITGKKFFDIDGDAVQEPSEPGLGHWPIFLDTNNDGMHGIGEPFTYADVYGNYAFTGLAPGTYRVREVQQPGWVKTTANPADITITANGQVFADIDFGNDRDDTVTLITGTKYNDIDGNGTQGVGEGGLAYWPIFVDANQNDAYDLGETLTWTNFAGDYAIAGLSVGSYSIREIQQPGWTQTSSNPVPVVLTTTGQTVADIDFGNRRDATTLITGRKFFDANANGVAEPGELGLRYWPIYIDSNSNGAYESGEPITTTDWNGVYSFAGVAPGSYRVREIQQGGWTQTSSNPADIVVTANGQTFAGIDFGNRGSGGPLPIGFGPPTDLEITKDAPRAIAGEQITYTLRVTNRGPADSYGVILGDQLQAGLVYESATPSQGTCFGTQTIICAVGPLAVGQSATVTIVAHVLSWVVDEVKNEGCVYSAATDTDPANNCAISRTPIGRSADLQLIKTADSQIAIAGQNLTYTMRVRNDGPSDSTNVTLEDELPPEVTFVSVSSTHGTCTTEVTSVTTVVCDLGTVANGETTVVTLVVHVADWVLDDTIIINDASVVSPWDSNPGNNGSTTFVPCGRAADLILTKTGPFTTVDAQVYYVLEVTNHGPSNSTGAIVGDHLPPDINFLSAVASQGICNFNGATDVLLCNLGPMLVGQSETVTVYVGVPQTVVIADVRNDGFVWGIEGDPAPWNNYGGAGGAVRYSSIGVVKDAPPTIIAGETLTYTLHVTNEGPDNSSNVIVGDTLPPGVVLVSATPTQGSCYAYNPIICFLGALAVNQSADVTIVVYIPPTLPEGMILSNTAFGYGGLAPFPGWGHANTRVRRVTDIDTVKIAPEVVVAGTEMTYTLRTRNRGPSEATNITLVDELPANVRFVRAVPSQGTCSDTLVSGVTTVSCALGNVAAMAVATVDIVVFVPSLVVAGTIIGNGYCAYATEIDSNLLNNCFHVNTAVTENSDLELIKTTPPGPVIAGENIQYTLEVHNRGPSDGRGIILGDTLPAPLVFVSATTTQGTCNFSSGVVLCDIGYLPVGQSQFVTITAFVPPSTPDGTIIANTACIVACGHDIFHANDCSTVRTTIRAQGILTGQVYHDHNGNALKESGDNGLPAWTVYLDDNLNDRLDPGERTTLTNGGGNYFFTGLGKSTYRVREVVQTGWIQTTANPPDVLVSGLNQTFVGGDFGNFKRIYITGTVFNDLNASASKNPGEPGLVSWTVFVDANYNGLLDGGERSTLSDTAGNYRFNDLGPGSYSIREVLQPGWTQTTPNPAPIIASSGVDRTGIDFGNFKRFVITGQKFHDFNNSGSKDVGEPGLSGWTIFIDANSNGALEMSERSTVTDVAGNYRLVDLGPGSYTIREVSQTGWTQTTPNPAPIVGLSGRDVANVDFGNRRAGTPAKITGGGSIDQSVRNFGFVVMPTTQGGVTTYFGSLEFQDKSLGYNLKATAITFINIESDRIHGQFTGTATLNGVAGYRFYVELEDRAEPGALVDKFRIRITGPGGFTYDSNTYATKGGLLDKGGNIQIHKTSSLTADTSPASPATSQDVDTHSLRTGVLVVAIHDQNQLGASQLARIQDAIYQVNDSLSPLGANVLLVNASSGVFADVHLNISQDSLCGGMADGVLGCATDDGDITLIAGWDWFLGSDIGDIGSKQFDLQTLVTHELGHAIGLGHASDSKSPMYALLAAGQSRRDLTSHDVALLGNFESEGAETRRSVTAVVSERSHQRNDSARGLFDDLQFVQSLGSNRRSLTVNSSPDEYVRRSSKSNDGSRSSSRDLKFSSPREQAALNQLPADRTNGRRGVRQVLPSAHGQPSLSVDLNEWSFDQILDSLVSDPKRVS